MSGKLVTVQSYWVSKTAMRRQRSEASLGMCAQKLIAGTAFAVNRQPNAVAAPAGGALAMLQAAYNCRVAEARRGLPGRCVGSLAYAPTKHPCNKPISTRAVRL